MSTNRKGIYSRNYEEREESGEGRESTFPPWELDSSSLATAINMSSGEAQALAGTSFNIVTNGRDPDIWGVVAYRNITKRKQKHRN